MSVWKLGWCSLLSCHSSNKSNSRYCESTSESVRDWPLHTEWLLPYLLDSRSPPLKKKLKKSWWPWVKLSWRPVWLHYPWRIPSSEDNAGSHLWLLRKRIVQWSPRQHQHGILLLGCLLKVRYLLWRGLLMMLDSSPKVIACPSPPFTFMSSPLPLASLMCVLDSAFQT